MYLPVFSDASPADFRDWWRLIRNFAGRVYEVRLPDVGRVPARAQALKVKLGVKRLPPSLVEWIAFLDDLRRRSDWATEDLAHLRARRFPEHQAVSLASTSVGYGWMQSGVALTDFARDDPPVSAYGYLEGRNQHVLRKSYPRLPLSLWALHMVVEHFGSNYSLMASPLVDPERFLRRLPSGVSISGALGSLRFVEGTGWFAWIRNGVTPCGRERWLRLRFTEGVKLRDIPPPIRDLVQMTRASLKWSYRRQHRKARTKQT
jgi:hypothetical protein